MKFAAFGRTRMLLDAILACVAGNHEVALIGTCPAAPEYTVTERDFEQLAEKFNCSFFSDRNINSADYLEMAQASGAQAAISVNWLTLIGRPMIEQFRYGVINAHAGDLPRYRGNACPNWAILAGEKQAVLTLHQMEVELDSGPILLQRAFPLEPDTYIGDVYRFLEQNIPAMFRQVLDGLEAGTIVPSPQPKDQALSLRAFPRLPSDGQIDWSQPAEHIGRLVRASAEPFAGAYTFLDGEKVIIWRARPDRLAYPYLGMPGQVAEICRKTGQVAVLCGDGVLVLEEIDTPSGGRGRAADLIKSSRSRFGLDLAEEVLKLRQRLAALENQLEESGN